VPEQTGGLLVQVKETAGFVVTTKQNENPTNGYVYQRNDPT